MYKEVKTKIKEAIARGWYYPMSKWRKKPVVIEAVQFLVGYFENPDIPQKFKDACCRKDDAGATFQRPHIHTLEGLHWITVGDWIIKGVKGEFYPYYKDEIFRETYEEIQLTNKETELEKAAKRAARTGNQSDLQKYLKMRRNSL